MLRIYTSSLLINIYILSFVIGICLVEFRPCCIYLLALLGASAGCVFRGILVGMCLIMSFEIEYCLTAISVTCPIYECFVEFCFVYWTEFAFDSVGTRLVVA